MALLTMFMIPCSPSGLYFNGLVSTEKSPSISFHAYISCIWQSSCYSFIVVRMFSLQVISRKMSSSLLENFHLTCCNYSFIFFCFSILAIQASNTTAYITLGPFYYWNDNCNSSFQFVGIKCFTPFAVLDSIFMFLLSVLISSIHTVFAIFTYL